mmetsp:Transcript_32702/g.56896  ORF Transcript_32702/g.56896 Transcript_32702/m.56896 type:complete len:203 (+) Transcript_32702:2391-2999(+)
MSKEVPLCLIKPRQKRPHGLKVPKRKPIEVFKYKAASVPKLCSHPSDVHSTTRLRAVDLKKLTKTVRAYFEVSSVKNTIKPDKLAHLNVPLEAKESFITMNTTEVPQMKPAQPEDTNATYDEEDEVFCNCNLPYKQGELMFKCEGFCDNWYHPACVGMQTPEVERQKHTTERWYCPDCLKQAYDIMVTCSNHKKDPKRAKYK